MEKEWIDVNGHINMAYYNVLFDRSQEGAFDMLGMGEVYIRERNLSCFTSDVHVSYRRELRLADKVYADFRIIAFDSKRLHFFQELRHLDGWLSATSENLVLSVDLSKRKVVPFPDDIAENLGRELAAQAHLPLPDGLGRPISIASRRMNDGSGGRAHRE